MGSPSLFPHTLRICKPVKSHFQAHTLTQNECRVMLISPQCCLCSVVERDDLCPTARRGHHCLGCVVARGECLVDPGQGQLRSQELLSLKWEQIYFFSR